MASMLTELERRRHHRQPRELPRRPRARMTVDMVNGSLRTWWSLDVALRMAHAEAARTGIRRAVRQVDVVDAGAECTWQVAWRITVVGVPCS